MDKGGTVEADMTLADLAANDFDAAVLPGGALNADYLRVDTGLKAFLRELDKARKPIAAICHAPWELASAGLTKGRRLTSYHAIQDDLRNAGAEWVDEEVVVDGNLVTSRTPADLPAFNEAMLRIFAHARAEGPITR
jgi:protease I